MTNPYTLLKIPQDATAEEIEAAYDRLFDKYEPLAETGDSNASAMLDQLNEAYDFLNDPEKRAELDSGLGSGRAATRASSSKSRAATTTRTQPRTRTSQQASYGGRSGAASQTIRTRARTRDLPMYDERPRLPLVPIMLLGLLVFGLAAVISFLILSKKDEGPAENRGSVVATVNGEPIYEQDYLERVEIDKQGAVNDPIFGGYLKTLTPYSQTQVLETLKSDSLDRLINFEVLALQAHKEGLFPETAAQQNSIIEDAKSRELNGANFADFLKQRNITAAQYTRRIIRNVVYALMADAHMPKTGTDDEKRSAFFTWICTTRQSYDVKINITFAVSNTPCTSDLPPELALPGIDNTVPEDVPTVGVPTTPQGPQGPPAAPTSTP